MDTHSPLPDKRETATVFRERLERLVRRAGSNRSRFADTAGIDRSALTQLLSGASTRLPRAETLIAIAATQGVSLDWLLGLSQDEGVTATIRPALELEEAGEERNEALLAEWHREAAGTKIRYVPTTIPDLLRTDAVIAYETRETRRPVESQITEAQSRIAYNRRPDTDMEVCMPVQQLETLANGTGLWAGLPAGARRAQLAHMRRLVDDLYPGFRLHLYDGRMTFSPPYTVFGPIRVAVYMGGMYLVLNAKEAVGSLTRHFDQLIRASVVQPHEAARFIDGLSGSRPAS